MLWRSENAVRLSLLVLYAVSRVLYSLAGIHFYKRLVEHGYQYVDIELLRTRALETLWYTYIQPPFLNGLAAIGLKLAGDQYDSVMHAVYLAAGAAMTLLLYEVQKAAGVRRGLAAGLTLLFVLSPGWVMYENYPLYEHFLMTFLLAAALAVSKLVDAPQWRMAGLFFLCLAMLSGLRVLYQWHFTVFCLLVLLWLLRKHKRMVLTAAALPLLFVFSLSFKNYLVVGQFTNSVWSGLLAYTLALTHMEEQEKIQMVKDGRLPPLALVEMMSSVENYRPHVKPVTPRGIPVLDEPVKANGDANLNHLVFFEAQRELTKLGIKAIRMKPKAYLRAVVIAWFCYFLPPSDFFHFGEMRAAVQPLDRAYNLLLYGQLREVSNRKELRRIEAEHGPLSLPLYTGTFLIIGIPALLLWTPWHAWRKRREYSPGQLTLLGFAWFNIVYNMMVANFLSSFETNRYRFATEGFYVLFLALALERGMRWWIKRHHADAH